MLSDESYPGPGATPTGDGGAESFAGVKIFDLSLPPRALKSAREDPMVVAGRAARVSFAVGAPRPVLGRELLCCEAGRLRGFEPPPTVCGRADTLGSPRVVPVTSMFRADL